MDAFAYRQWEYAPVRFAFDGRREAKKQGEEGGDDGFGGGEALNERGAHTHI